MINFLKQENSIAKPLALSKVISVVICSGPITNNIYRQKKRENTEKQGRLHCGSTSSTTSSLSTLGGGTGCGRWGKAPTSESCSTRRLPAVVKRWPCCTVWECGGRRQWEKMCIPQENKAFMYVKLEHKEKLKWWFGTPPRRKSQLYHLERD